MADGVRLERLSLPVRPNAIRNGAERANGLRKHFRTRSRLSARPQAAR